MPETLVVAVDGSSGSDSAFHYACEHSKHDDTILILNGWANNPDYTPLLEITTERAKRERESSKQILDKYAKLCSEKRKRGCAISSIEYHGGTTVLSETICGIAKKEKASTIVVGSYGHSLGKRLFLGSVSSSLATQCDRNVIIVKNPLI